ncbi:porin [Brevundimonas sp.]|uniref:porin n=1 Tax=Brevundimonas sp. TaxID=1871086 RepID=UPI000DB270F1|nr:porin [Brevundimonas sp.]PZU77354.1 MAG: hypothetical protein DI531_00795 [Brevundimonas sp.]
MFRSLTIAAMLVAAAPAAAFAQSGGSWSFEVGAGTDNRSKDASKSGNDGYAYGSATWQSGDGLFYVMPSVQTIQGGGSNLETILTAGYQPEAFGYQFDVNLAYKYRIDANPGYDDDTWEVTGNVSRAIGPAKARLQVQYSPDQVGAAKAFTWIEGRLGWTFDPKLRGSVALGRREQNNAPDYTGWNAGVTYALTDALDLDLRYYDTDAHTFGEQYEDALVAKVSFGF